MKKIVVIGGGFAGAHAARKLEKYFNVSLVDTKDYFEFTPGILRTIVEPRHTGNIQILHRHYLKRAKVIIGEISELNEQSVFIGKKKIPFDYLIICSGSSYNTPIKESNLVSATRAQHLRDCYDELRRAERILIIGGGLVGVELAGEICWKYGQEKKITIVHAKDELIERNHFKAINYAEKYLRKKGVSILFNEKIVDSQKGVYISDKGNEFRVDIAFLCTGITPNFKFIKGGFKKYLNEKNQIKVNSYLQLIGKENIFSAGDINDRAVEKTAQNAIKQGHIVVKNILALESGKKLREYHSERTPMVISLGKYKGILTYKNFILRGFLPAVVKMLVEKLEMMKMRL
ncbi:MAG: FAD-dependent oxidoreductase [Nanoarchaeota archaeon]